jgi:hypothetical protein
MEIDLKGSEVETMETNYSSTTVLLVRHAQARSADGSYGLDTPLSGLGATAGRSCSSCTN